MKKHPTKPPADDFRTTYLSSRGAQVLGQHALSLPVGHPVRETVRLLLERWSEGAIVSFSGGAQVELDIEDIEEVMGAAPGDALADAVIGDVDEALREVA